MAVGDLGGPLGPRAAAEVHRMLAAADRSKAERLEAKGWHTGLAEIYRQSAADHAKASRMIEVAIERVERSGDVAAD